MPRKNPKSAVIATAAAPVVAAIATALPKQKYMILADGEPLPYNETVFQMSPGARVVDALPSSYTSKVKAFLATEDAAERERQAYAARMVEAQEQGRVAARRRDKAHQQAILNDPRSEDVEGEVTGSDAFVLGTATAEQLVAFAKSEFNVDLNPDNGVESLREEVAMLAGLS